MLVRRASLVLLVAATALSTVQLSGATFSAQSQSTGTLGASVDWTPPVAQVQGATGLVRGTTTITATASDVHSAVRDVRLEVRPAGSTGAWAPICTVATAPYSCSWSTVGLPDGGYELRAVATDVHGNAGTSTPVARTVDNAGPVVSIDEDALPDDLRGTVTVGVLASDAGSGVRDVVLQRSANGTSGWTTICTATTAPYACSWNTVTTVGTADVFLRAVATDNLGSSTTSAVVLVGVDNTAPTVTMGSQGSPLAGTVTLTATASDADSGIASVLVEQRASAGSPWIAVCTATTSPYTCRWDTTQVADGTTYAFRATATDSAGNTTTTAATSTSTVDNRTASVSLEDPGAFLRGTVPLLANANAPGGVASVAVQYQLSGTTTWTTICTDTTAPYGCDWDTTRVAGGSYALRAVLTPVTGAPLVSAVLTGRTVDNAPLRAHDVQATNGGVLGRVDAGDVLTLTYDGVVDPASVLSGWTGAARGVSVRLRDGSAVGGAGGEDVLDVVGANLGLVNTRGNYVRNQAATFSATMTAVSTTVNGLPATRITVRLDALTGNDTTRTQRGSRTMAWAPSTAARGTTGLAVSATPVDELGPLDRDF